MSQMTWHRLARGADRHAAPIWHSQWSRELPPKQLVRVDSPQSVGGDAPRDTTSQMIAASYPLGASPPKPTSEERELALCTFRPRILASNVTSRVWSPPVAPPLPPTSEESALRLCAFKPTIQASNDRSRDLTGVSQVPKTPPQHAAPMAEVGERGKEADVPLQVLRTRGGGVPEVPGFGGRSSGSPASFGFADS